MVLVLISDSLSVGWVSSTLVSLSLTSIMQFTSLANLLLLTRPTFIHWVAVLCILCRLQCTTPLAAYNPFFFKCSCLQSLEAFAQCPLLQKWKEKIRHLPQPHLVQQQFKRGILDFCLKICDGGDLEVEPIQGRNTVPWKRKCLFLFCGQCTSTSLETS